MDRRPQRHWAGADFRPRRRPAQHRRRYPDRVGRRISDSGAGTIESDVAGADAGGAAGLRVVPPLPVVVFGGDPPKWFFPTIGLVPPEGPLVGLVLRPAVT